MHRAMWHITCVNEHGTGEYEEIYEELQLDECQNEIPYFMNIIVILIIFYEFHPKCKKIKINKIIIFKLNEIIGIAFNSTISADLFMLCRMCLMPMTVFRTLQITMWHCNRCQSLRLGVSSIQSEVKSKLFMEMHVGNFCMRKISNTIIIWSPHRNWS